MTTWPPSLHARAEHLVLLLRAYASGVFPMADPETDQIDWYKPTRRGIIPLDGLHVPRRLERTIAREPFDIRFNTAFEKVMRRCAESAPGREQTWINETLIDWYSDLHELGFAHCVEAWEGDELVGGVYGVSLRGLFAGESMFHRRTDASKIALVHLVRHLRARGYVVFDTQFYTPHLGQFGCIEISAIAYERLLEQAMQVEPGFGYLPASNL